MLAIWWWRALIIPIQHDNECCSRSKMKIVVFVVVGWGVENRYFEKVERWEMRVEKRHKNFSIICFCTLIKQKLFPSSFFFIILLVVFFSLTRVFPFIIMLKASEFLLISRIIYHPQRREKNSLVSTILITTRLDCRLQCFIEKNFFLLKFTFKVFFPLYTLVK